MEKTTTIHHFSTYLLFVLLLAIPAQSADPAAYSCGGAASTNGSARISDNIDKLLPILVSRTIQNRFANASYAGDDEDGPGRVYGLAQCRADVPQDECTSCIRDAARIVRDAAHCLTQSDATIWYDFCFLRYSTDDFLGAVDTTGWYLYNVEYASGLPGFNETLGDLMRNVSRAAAVGEEGLGKDTRRLSPFVTLYGLVQCTRDLSDFGCAQCLSRAIDFPDFCIGKKGCRVLFRSCYVRFELYPFFYPLDSTTTAATGNRSEKSTVGVET